MEEKKFNIAILVTDYLNVIHYIDEISIIQKNAKNIEFTFFGFKDDDKQEFKIVEKLNTIKYFKPVSIIHFYKLIKERNINLLFIPIIDDVYNKTSENNKKYIDFSLLRIPILAPSIFPYNAIIMNKENGFLYNPKNKEAIPELIFDIYLKTIRDKKTNLSKIDIVIKNVDSDINANYYLQNQEIKDFTNYVYN